MEWWVATWDWNTLLYLKLYCFNALRCMPTQPDNHIIISIIKRNGKSLFIKRVQKKHHRRHEASNTAVRFCWYKVIVSIIHFSVFQLVCNVIPPITFSSFLWSHQERRINKPSELQILEGDQPLLCKTSSFSF